MLFTIDSTILVENTVYIAKRETGLLWALVIREFKGRYRRSVFGPLWALIQPVVYSILFVLVGRVLGMRLENTVYSGTPYVVYLFCALLPWTFFSNAVTRCTSSLTNNASIVKKTAVSREIFPLSVVIVSLIDFAITFVILFVLLLVFRIPLHFSVLWTLPLILITIALATVLGLALAAIGTYRMDVFFAVPLLLQAWMFATPIFYDASLVPADYRWLYNLNPMVGVVEGFRHALILGTSPDAALLSISLISVAVLGCLTWPLFRYVSQYFADVL